MGSDHAGYEAKGLLKPFVESLGFVVTDLGAFDANPIDYPDVAREVGEKVLEHAKEGALGVLICGTGVGMSIAANKLKGIRAALVTDENLAEMSRKHNDANVLAMGARTTDIELMKKITEKFLKTPFEAEERHLRRVEKMDKMNIAPAKTGDGQDGATC
ncbi:ribose 5-phosphate isomerase B [Candidatus Gracilibacteria bacterium]|nr:ribose 5-phosphate isomerase B [Candidatus Gracilibacteria bacterium]